MKFDWHKNLERIKQHPIAALYGLLLGIIALLGGYSIYKSGAFESALVDIVMAGFLIVFMLKSCLNSVAKESKILGKMIAWSMIVGANFLALLPTNEFPGNLSSAFALSLLICAFVLYFSGKQTALGCIAPTLWCCVFMPYHEEFMLLLSYPLRLTATFLSSVLLKLCGVEVICSGTSLSLPNLEIAITDACSGINQLDAFILIAVIIVNLLHKKVGWKLLHFAFIMPAIIIGNSLRIVLTVWLFKLFGEVVLENVWHVSLGYSQIVLALIIFVAIGKVFHIGTADDQNQAEEGSKKSC